MDTRGIFSDKFFSQARRMSKSESGIDLTILNTGGGLEYHGHAQASTFPKTKAYIARTVRKHEVKRMGSRQTFDK